MSVKKVNMNRIVLAIIVVFSATACQQQVYKDQEKSVQEITSATKLSNATIIRNPISADSQEDTINVAKFEFEALGYNFGEVEEGEIVTHTYRFRNVGKVPMVISDARSTCGCTIPDWPKEPIEPGASGQISVRFNTKGKTNAQRKPIYITANTYPVRSELYLEGFVKSEKDIAVNSVNQ